MTDHDNEKIDLMIKKLDRLDDRSKSIYQGLYGIADTDDKGLLGKVNTFCDDHNKLKRNFYILVAFLIGSGVLGTSIWALVT